MYDLMYHMLVASALAGLPSAHAPATTQAAPAARPAPAPAQARQASGTLLGEALPSGQLDEARGGSDTVVSDAQLAGTASGNSASQVNTGANSIATGSFAGAVGLPVVIQNTGANVLIQHSTIVNVQFK